MISPQSYEFFSKQNQLTYKNYQKKPDFKKFSDLVKKGIVPRPHYALGLLLAAKQAHDLGLKKIKVLELGCYNFDGIIDLENYANDIKGYTIFERRVTSNRCNSKTIEKQ